MLQETVASVEDIVPFRFTLVPVHKPEELHANMRSAIARGLPKVSLCPAHDLELSIVGGGPSLEDTCKDLTGYVAAVNGALSFLLDRGIVPQMCGVCDPSPHMVDIIVAEPRVTYFVASCVHPSVFDKLLDAGCQVYLWHCSSIPGGEALLDEIEPDWLLIGGGSTMGLRWITLGYDIGFRKFHLHGFDSSFRGKSSHAYPDHQDAKDWIGFEGFQTRPNFIGQVVDFIGWMERLKGEDVEPVAIKVYGEGLLQEKFKKWKALNPGWHEGGARPEVPSLTKDFVWPPEDAVAAADIEADVRFMHRFVDRIPLRRTAVQAGGLVGVYPAHLARFFQHVHTFEPHPANYACLAKNIAGAAGNIRTYHAGLGAADGTCATRMFSLHNSGAVRVTTGNTVPMRTIDGLDLRDCDLIWLDIEGYELNALKGAERTIERCRPAIIVEENALSEMHGIPKEVVHAWLKERGYRRAMKYRNDSLYLAEHTTESERKKYVKAWADYPRYRVRSPGERLVDQAVEVMGMTPGERIIDFGCGPGRATRKLIEAGFAATGVDIAANCLDVGIDVPFREACLWEMPADLNVDWGYCCDVMEHIPTDRVDEVLAAISNATTKGVFFQIAFADDTFGRSMGEQLHLTIQSPDWWLLKLKGYWPNCELSWPLEEEIGIRGVITAKP